MHQNCGLLVDVGQETESVLRSYKFHCLELQDRNHTGVVSLQIERNLIYCLPFCQGHVLTMIQETRGEDLSVVDSRLTLSHGLSRTKKLEVILCLQIHHAEDSIC